MADVLEYRHLKDRSLGKTAHVPAENPNANAMDIS
jgi:hypothetical protein